MPQQSSWTKSVSSLLTSISPPVTVFLKLLTMIRYSIVGFSYFGRIWSLLKAAIGRFLRIDGGLGGLLSLADKALLKHKDSMNYLTLD